MIYVIAHIYQLQRGATGASRNGGHGVGSASDVTVRVSICLMNGCNAELCVKIVYEFRRIGAQIKIDGDCGGI